MIISNVSMTRRYQKLYKQLPRILYFGEYFQVNVNPSYKKNELNYVLNKVSCLHLIFCAIIIFSWSSMHFYSEIIPNAFL